MRLICRSFVMAAVVLTACHEPSAPLQPVNYVLTTIGARPLPTYAVSTSDGFTVLSGTFLLDGDSRAVANEQRRDVSGNEYSFSAQYRYTITGNDIQFEFDPPCTAPIACKSPPRGTISGDHLLINYGGGIYDYQQLRLIDLPPG